MRNKYEEIQDRHGPSSMPVNPRSKVGENEEVLRLMMRGIVKRFPGVVANDRVDLVVRRGEIHGLLGENGAGKTTLMKILYGLYQPDEGEIYLNGERVEIHSPRDALALKIGMIHQKFMLVPTLTVAENIIIGLKEDSPILNFPQVCSKIKQLADQYGINIDPRAKIGEISVGEQQRVEIIKALYRQVDLLIMDEPTSILAPQEVDRLFLTLKALVADGLTIIFITHKLNEVMNITDRVTTLRKGRVVKTVVTSNINKTELANMMVGRDVLFHFPKRSTQPGDKVVEVKQLKAFNNKGLLALKGVSFHIRAGEILGLAGVSGNGQSELAQVLAGIRESCGGNFSIAGNDVTGTPPRGLFKLGEAYIPARRNLALAGLLSLETNLILKIYSKPPFSHKHFLNRQAIRSHAERLIADYSIKTPSSTVLAMQLSGGNLQRLLLARELSQNPRFLIAHQPTRGLDVGAAEFVRNEIIAARDRTTSVLLIAEDLDELLQLSDRIMVIYEGQLRVPSETSREILGLLMAGENE